MRNEKGSLSFNKCLLSTYCVPGSSRDLGKKGLGQTGIVSQLKFYSQNKSCKGQGWGPLPCKVERLEKAARSVGVSEASAFSQQSRCGLRQLCITSSSARICTIS